MSHDEEKEGKRVATLPSEDEIFKFECLLEAGAKGKLSLIRGFVKDTDKEVSMVAIVNPEPGSSVQIMPIAVIIEGNPFDQYDPPDELPDTPRIITPH